LGVVSGQGGADGGLACPRGARRARGCRSWLRPCPRGAVAGFCDRQVFQDGAGPLGAALAPKYGEFFRYAGLGGPHGTCLSKKPTTMAPETSPEPPAARPRGLPIAKTRHAPQADAAERGIRLRRSPDTGPHRFMQWESARIGAPGGSASVGFAETPESH